MSVGIISDTELCASHCLFLQITQRLLSHISLHFLYFFSVLALFGTCGTFFILLNFSIAIGHFNDRSFLFIKTQILKLIKNRRKTVAKKTSNESSNIMKGVIVFREPKIFYSNFIATQWTLSERVYDSVSVITKKRK